VQVEPDGWARFESLGVRVRFRFDATDSRAEPVAVEFLDGVLTARRLAGVPFGRIEVVANGSEARKLIYGSAEGVWPAGEDPTPLPATLPVVDTGGGTSVDDLYGMLGELGEHTSGFSGRHSADFYKWIAAVYYRHAVKSNSPGQDIADRLGVPVTNVWRWVRVCREKGYLPPARAGKS